MGLTWLKTIAGKVQKKQNSIFTYSVEKQKAYIAHFPEPKDRLERSYFQYCCQMKLYGGLLHALLNLFALPMSLLYLMKFSHKHEGAQEAKSNCVFIRYDLPENIVPDSLRQRYPEMLSINTPGNRLDKEDIAFLKTIFKRYPFSWMFWLKMVLKVSQYSDTIKKHAPNAIISCDEYSYTSSAITDYCNSKGITRINVMHGEKLYFMRDSFMHYDAFYVWDQHYVDLLTELRAEKAQFQVELPASMRIIKRDDVSVRYDYTYYLGDESTETLQAIAGTMRVLCDNGKRVCIRPHPRFSDPKLIAELFSFANIEDCKTVDIAQSLLQTGAAVSMYSTVLNQASSNSIPVVIDDIRNPSYFEKLKELRYICLHHDHKLLSHITGETQ